MSYGITQYDIEKALRDEKIRDEKNKKIMLESDRNKNIFFREMFARMNNYTGVSYYQKMSVITKLWKEKQMKDSKLLNEKIEKEYNLYNDFKTTMLAELKRDYINKYGNVNYMIDEDSIIKDMMEIIDKKYHMLLIWQITS